MNIPGARAGQNRERGSVLIEFALSSTLLFLLFFGIVNFARLFTAAEVVADAAAAGTQYGALQPTNSSDTAGMQAAATADAPNAPGLSASASQFCTSSIGGAHTDCPVEPATCDGVSCQKYIEVDVSMPFTATLTFPGMPTTMTISRSSIVRVQ